MIELTKTLTKEILDEVIELSDYSRATTQQITKDKYPNREDASLWDIWILHERTKNLPERSLLDVLKTLSEEQIYELTALMWMGRGDFRYTPINQAFLDAIEHARETVDPTAVVYLMEKPLKEYLLEALTLKPEPAANP